MLRGYSRKNRKNSRKSKGEQGTINIKLLLYELGDLKILGRGVEISSPDLFVQIKIGYFSVWETLNRVHSLQYEERYFEKIYGPVGNQYVMV